MLTGALFIGSTTFKSDKRICLTVYFKIQLTKTNKNEYFPTKLLKTLTNHKSILPADRSGSKILELKFKHPLTHLYKFQGSYGTKYDDTNKIIYFTWNLMSG